MHDLNRMLEMTIELLVIVENAEQEYDKRRETKVKGDFYSEVKPFADHAHSLSVIWGKGYDFRGGFERNKSVLS